MNILYNIPLYTRFHTSAYFLSRKIEQSDIRRYSDKYRKVPATSSLLDYINTSSQDSSRYIPHELMDGRYLVFTNDTNLVSTKLSFFFSSAGGRLEDGQKKKEIQMCYKS
jgi:hypothetical protein